MFPRTTNVFSYLQFTINSVFRLIELTTKHFVTLHHLIVEVLLLSLLVAGARELLSFLHLAP
jgi:hypothetical protein